MYILKIWNGKYGNNAKFVAQNKANNKFTEFSTAHPSDVAWVAQDITKNPEYKGWESFEDEPVEDLEAVIM